MLRFGLAVVTLLVATAVAVTSALIVLPPLGDDDAMLRTAVTEFSLNLLLPILLALALAAFSGWSGMPRVGRVAAILAVLAVPLALLPAIRGGIEAQDRGIRIDPWEYMSGTGFDVPMHSDETHPYGPAADTREVDAGESKRELVVWRPDDKPAGPLPAVINVHDDDNGYDSWNAWFADQGMLSLDLATDQPGEVKCALSWLYANATEFGIDPNQIVLFGTGFSGQVAMLAAYGDDADIPSACPDAPALATQPERTEPPRAESRVAALLTLYPASDPPDRAAEPYRHLDAQDPPTLIAHGGQDPVTPIAESQRAAAELDVAGVPSALVEIGYAGHGFDFGWGGFAAQITRAEMGRFLHQTLG